MKRDYNGMRMNLKVVSARLNGELDPKMRDQLIALRAKIIATLRAANEPLTRTK